MKTVVNIIINAVNNFMYVQNIYKLSLLPFILYLIRMK